MNACGTRCGNHVLRLCVIIETGNVFGNRASNKLNVLRQVADLLTKDFRRPLIIGRSIQANFSTRRLPDADQRSGQATTCQIRSVQ